LITDDCFTLNPAVKTPGLVSGIEYKKLGVLHGHPTVRRHGMGEPHVAANHTVMTDVRVTSQNGGVGIHGNVVLDGRVTFVALSATQLAVVILAKRVEGSQRDAVI